MKVLFVAMVLALVVLVGCGGSAEPERTAQLPATPAQVATGAVANPTEPPAPSAAPTQTPEPTATASTSPR